MMPWRIVDLLKCLQHLYYTFYNTNVFKVPMGQPEAFQQMLTKMNARKLDDTQNSVTLLQDKVK